MSLISAIDSAAHTTARWFLNALKKTSVLITGVQPVADRVFPWAKMVIDGILIAEGQGAINPEVNDIIDEINRDLDVAAAALHDVGPTPKVATLLTATAANIDGLVAAGHIKNSGNVALIKNIVTSLLSLVGISTLPTPMSAPAQ